MGAFFKRLIPENIAGILGIVGVVIPLVREVLMSALRLVAVFVPSIKLWIIPVGGFFDMIAKGYEQLKNLAL